MERIKLNLIPSGVAPIVHLSQYDDGRQFGIDLFEGESVYVLDGTETLTVNSRKPDGHVVTLSVTNTGTSSLDVDTIEQLTAVHGVSYAKLKIEKGSVTVATLPFLIDVSRDPLENGDPSESFVDNLQTQIALAVADQYDSNNVFFDNVPTSGHGIGYAVTSEGVKTEVDNLNTALAGKVDTTDFDATNLPITSGSATDTKDYIDSGLSGKANASSLSTVATSGNYDDLLNKPIHFRGTLGGDVLQVMKDLPDNCLCCYADSNNPTNQPTNGAWGSYFIYKTTGRARAYYCDSDRFAISSRVGSDTTTMTWRILQ